MTKTYIEITREARARGLEAAALRYDGLKLREIAERMGIGVERARHLVERGNRLMDWYFSSLNECAVIVARRAERREPSQ